MYSSVTYWHFSLVGGAYRFSKWGISNLLCNRPWMHQWCQNYCSKKLYLSRDDAYEYVPFSIQQSRYLYWWPLQELQTLLMIIQSLALPRPSSKCTTLQHPHVIKLVTRHLAACNIDRCIESCDFHLHWLRNYLRLSRATISRSRSKTFPSILPSTVSLV